MAQRRKVSRSRLASSGASTGGVVVVAVPSGAPKEIKLTDALGTVLGTWTP
jgi:hypothetical protein